MSVLEAGGVAAFGLLVGVISALFGVGGGLLMVPFMVLVLGEGQHLAEGTSLIAMVPIAATGAISHWRRGYVSATSAAFMAVGGIAGAALGALTALALEAESLTKIFGLVTVLAGLRLVVQGWRDEGGAAGQAGA